jgi:DNA-binding CsgD family transcriptional regulator
MYWKRLVWEVLNKEKESNLCFLTSYKDQGEEPSQQLLSKKKTSKKMDDDKYLLEEKDNKIICSWRESRYISCIIMGKTLKETGKCLGLSVRTAEFYIKNIKGKLKCRNRKELLKKVLSSKFWEDHIESLPEQISFFQIVRNEPTPKMEK